MKKLMVLLILCTILFQEANAQGCISVRNISGFGQFNLTDNAFSTSTWQVNIATRYFKAYHDYRGKTNLNTAPQNENIIRSFSTDLGITRLFNKGWSLDFLIPISANSRETTVEHGGPNTPHFKTHSFGLGDIRIVGYKWLLPPRVRQKGNIQAGLGLKFATGDYKFQDYFHWNDSTRVLAAVNPSIQLGDGGTGIITELNGFYFLSDIFSLYGNAYYLINPREQNGTLATLGGRPASDVVKRAGGDVLSVADVFSFRAGMNYSISNWAFSAGFRHEGSPVHDLIGGSNGARRSGYNFSVEPGINYKMKKATLYAYVPVIISRKITQTVPDINITKITGTYTQGPGGSGDYQIFLGVLFKL